ncbi:hypothetical protein GCM10009718_33310 [Isoptericola halotolerans]|uniref:Tail assembly chaperone n=1 Tax=Isoptericola halotolerans TaxID=300560 RepID=A0ABX2A5T0_9MICO|nr:hypothetical protein [Isoptericola halotolerans]NOV98219.1 hypothetical protein [Isoptericola halotolerans]
MDQTKDAAGVTEDFDLLAFVETGTIATREVVIYTDHEAARRCQEIEAALDALDDDGPDDRKQDAPLGAESDETRRAELEAEAEQWLERLQASKMTWTVRALSNDEIKASFDVVAAPKMPVPPKEGVAQAIKDRWHERVEEYGRKKAEADEDRNLVLVANAVVGIETPAGSTGSVTVEQLKALRSKPHGQQWIDRLYTAVDAATSDEVEPPVPTSPGRSTSSRG